MTSDAHPELNSEHSTPRRPRRKPGENRERLIAAAIREFGTHGYHGASTSSISDAAEVSQPNVYASFTTKQQLFDACIIRTCEMLMQSETAAAHLAVQGQLHRMLYQAVATAPRLQQQAPSAYEAIVELRSAIGTARFDQMLAAAGRDLLSA